MEQVYEGNQKIKIIFSLPQVKKLSRDLALTLFILYDTNTLPQVITLTWDKKTIRHLEKFLHPNVKAKKFAKSY